MIAVRPVSGQSGSPHVKRTGGKMLVNGNSGHPVRPSSEPISLDTCPPGEATVPYGGSATGAFRAWTPYMRTKGHGCPACKGMKATPDNNLASVRPDPLHSWHYQRNQNELKLVPTEVLPQSNKKVCWTCPHVPSQRSPLPPGSVAAGCPYCAGKGANHQTMLQLRVPCWLSIGNLPTSRVLSR